MTRFYGKIGYGTSTKVAPGVYSDAIVERPYYGTVLEDARSISSNDDKVVDDIRITNRLSIVADGYALQNFQHIKYVEWNGIKWKVPAASVHRPRLELTLGDLYDGP